MSMCKYIKGIVNSKNVELAIQRIIKKNGRVIRQ